MNPITVEWENQGLWVTPNMTKFAEELGKKDNIKFIVCKNSSGYFDPPNYGLAGDVGFVGCIGIDINGKPIYPFVTPVDEKLEILKISFTTDKTWFSKMHKFINMLELTPGYGGKLYNLYSEQILLESKTERRGIFPGPAFTKFKEALLMIHPEVDDIQCAFYPSPISSGISNWGKINEFVLDKPIKNNEIPIIAYDKTDMIPSNKVAAIISIFSADLVKNMQLLIAILNTI